ncbi:hypothetical protein EZ449_22365 [Pedobacter frigidisoli]|uniref:Uncharacterized protein n=1 Tax=Pedobacter frigidisoli TaxID=2530455 RepID=A0A4R0NBQ1_9SPHI|nr:hypothetical protein EZ449_22365 [Pedobacter frigidisoli]
MGATCAIACFVGVLKLPIVYYTFLRTIVSLGAILFIYGWLRYKNYPLAFIFILVLIFFNPLFPFYLHRKSIWIPLDIIAGLLFLLIGFYRKKEPLEEEKVTEVLPVRKTYSRDRIVSEKEK